MKKLLFKSFILLLITIVACSKSDEIVQEESVKEKQVEVEKEIVK